MNSTFWYVGLFIALAAFVSVKAGKLTTPAAVTGWLVGLLVFLGAQYVGLAMLGAFFILGTVATSWGKKQKEALQAADKNEAMRTTGQVLANGGIAALTALLAYIFPEHKTVLVLMMAASLSSATADTISSELGVLYGKTTYNILTWKKDRRGENGVVSIEGFLFGILGSAAIAAIYAAGFGFNHQFFLIIITGTIGNITDSFLGATLERKNYITNNAVNFLNTLTAALAMWLFWK